VSIVLDDALVAAALLASLAYALFALGPRTWRRALLLRIALRAGRAPSWLGMTRLAARLASAAGSSGSCGGCESCGSGSKPSGLAPAAGEAVSGATHSRAAEIKIPLASIGRRRP
jgi:hypothetical protein